jgi:L-aspartate oxidase
MAERFPTVHAACRAAGIDPATDLIPIAPAAHYHMGGVLTDANGRTSIDGLWAAGEVTSTGAHGANRLASNSLLEAVVFAARIARDIGGLLPAPHVRAAFGGTVPQAGGTVGAPSADEQELRRLMSANVGVVRNGAGLAHALREFAALERRTRLATTRDMALAALLIAAAAWRRTESRGGHFRSDFPHADPKQATRSYLTLGDAFAIAQRATAKAA